MFITRMIAIVVLAICTSFVERASGQDAYYPTHVSVRMITNGPCNATMTNTPCVIPPAGRSCYELIPNPDVTAAGVAEVPCPEEPVVQPSPPAKARFRIDLGWWTRGHAVAAAFDGASTLYWERACTERSWCYERDPLARAVLGRRPSTTRMALIGSVEVLGVAMIPNTKVRRAAQIGLIAAHVAVGVKNIHDWNGKSYR